MLFIKRCIVAVDAIYTQEDTVKKIGKGKQTDYVVSLKENHIAMYNEV